MAKMLGELGLNVGVEVGTRFGDFAKVLLTENPNCRLTCVDPWAAYNNRSQGWQDDSLERCRALLSPFIDQMRVTLMREFSMDAVRKVEDGCLDFVFIDGNHDFDFAMEDIIYWSKKVKSGGVVAVHDYHPFCGSDVRFAVDAYVAGHDIRPWYVTREMEPTAFWEKQ
jgi:predicted O-methyltransferase YrrM